MTSSIKIILYEKVSDDYNGPDSRHSCADANGNTYFLGCESVKESFYYIYPILVKINADGKIAWTKKPA